MKGTGMFVGKLKFIPKGDQSGRSSGFIFPTKLKETIHTQYDSVCVFLYIDISSRTALSDTCMGKTIGFLS